MPSFGARWNAHELVKFLYMDVTALPLQYQTYNKSIVLKFSYQSCNAIINRLEKNYISHPSHTIVENSRPRMVTTCSVMIILFLESLTTTRIFACLGFININNLLCWSRRALNIYVGRCRCVHSVIYF